VQFSDSIRTFSSALLISGLLVAAIVMGKDILIPMTLAVFLAFILFPIVIRLKRAGVPKGFAVAAVVLGVVVVLIGFTGVVSKQVISLTADMSIYRYNFVEKVRSIAGHSAGTQNDKSELSRAADAVETIGAAIRDELIGRDGKVSDAAPKPEGKSAESKTVVVESEGSDRRSAIVGDYAGTILALLAQAALTFLLTAFLLAQYQDLRDRVVRVVGTEHMTDTISAMGEAGERLSQLFLTQALLNIGFGSFVGLALWLIGVPNAVLWGVVTAVMRFVPYMGSILSALPPLVLAAAVDPGWTMFLETLVLFLFGEPLMGHIVEPLVLGKRAGISPFAMVTSASFWTFVWGPVGLILAAPLTMTLVIVGRYIKGLEFFGILLGDEPALTPPHKFYHRLLSEDSVSAAEQVDRAIQETSLEETADGLIFPALVLAAQDYRRGRLDREQINELIQTSTEVWQALHAHEAEDVAAAATPRGSALIVPARGAIDRIAADFIAQSIKSLHGLDISISEMSGLTALAQAKSLSSSDQPDQIVIVSVSQIELRQMSFIVRRAIREFGGSKVTVVDFRGVLDDISTNAQSYGDNVTLLRVPSAATRRFALATRDREAHRKVPPSLLQPAVVAQ
jgi:predicted PurR-regulated permease PerM